MSYFDIVFTKEIRFIFSDKEENNEDEREEKVENKEEEENVEN